MPGARLALAALLTALPLLTALLAVPQAAAAPSPEAAAAAAPSGSTAKPRPDPRWVFYTSDRRRYTSPWFGGARRIMIPFGCTRAPYYSPDPRCTGGRGFHHGIDVATPCRTRLFSARYGWVVDNGGLGPAYGADPLLIRNHRLGFDLVIGHVRRTFVEPGDRVRPGMKIALASDDGAPDGCHLHFEQRAKGGGLSTAVRPRALLDLTVKRRR